MTTHRSKASFVILIVFPIVAAASIITAIGLAGQGQPASVTQPVSARAAASQMDCENFREYGSGLISGLGIRLFSADSGTCYVGGKEYTVYTFSDKDVRDTYIQAAAGIGVAPKWETDNSVAVAN